MFFDVQGRTGKYSVRYDRDRNEWNCTCEGSTIYSRECRHIKACKEKVAKWQK